jgi:hypothetical protein
VTYRSDDEDPEVDPIVAGAGGWNPTAAPARRGLEGLEVGLPKNDGNVLGAFLGGIEFVAASCVLVVETVGILCLYRFHHLGFHTALKWILWIAVGAVVLAFSIHVARRALHTRADERESPSGMPSTPDLNVFRAKNPSPTSSSRTPPLPVYNPPPSRIRDLLICLAQ